MGNQWTRLLQETSKHGGPLAMRQHYANLGAKHALEANRNTGMKGFVIGVGAAAVAIGASWAASKAVDGAAAGKRGGEAPGAEPGTLPPDGLAGDLAAAPPA